MTASSRITTMSAGASIPSFTSPSFTLQTVMVTLLPIVSFSDALRLRISMLKSFSNMNKCPYMQNIISPLEKLHSLNPSTLVAHSRLTALCQKRALMAARIKLDFIKGSQHSVSLFLF